MTIYLFDAYGTLLDLTAAFDAAKDRLGSRHDAMLQRWRSTQLDYAWLAALGGAFRNFEDITRDAFRDALAADGIDDPDLVATLTGAFATLPAYTDAASTLQGLRKRGDKTAILSNGSPNWLAASAASSGLTPHLDQNLSVAPARTYKPAPAAYAIGVDAFGGDAHSMIFVSSNWWDVVGARQFGYQVIWIDRGQNAWPRSVMRPDFIAASLTDIIQIAPAAAR